MADLTEEQLAMYQETVSEVMMEPLEYVKHDTNAREDDGLTRLVMDYGLEALAVFWIVVECLASRKGHAYDISDDRGMDILAMHMSTCGYRFGREEAAEWLKRLVVYDLVDREGYIANRLMNRRISNQAYDVAERTAQKRAGAWKTNAARASKR